MVSGKILAVMLAVAVAISLYAWSISGNIWRLAGAIIILVALSAGFMFFE